MIKLKVESYIYILGVKVESSGSVEIQKTLGALSKIEFL